MQKSLRNTHSLRMQHFLIQNFQELLDRKYQEGKAILGQHGHGVYLLDLRRYVRLQSAEAFKRGEESFESHYVDRSKISGKDGVSWWATDFDDRFVRNIYKILPVNMEICKIGHRWVVLQHYTRAEW